MGQQLQIELDDDIAVPDDEAAARDLERFASSLLSTVLRNRGVDSRTATEELRAMPGALEAAHAGSAQGRRGEITLLDEL